MYENSNNRIIHNNYSFEYKNELELKKIVNYGLDKLTKEAKIIQNVLDFYQNCESGVLYNHQTFNTFLIPELPNISNQTFTLLNIHESWLDLYNSFKKENVLICPVKTCEYLLDNIPFQKFNKKNLEIMENIEGFVYFAVSGNLLKIGASKKPENRVKRVSSELGQKFDLIHKINTQNMFEMEKYYHCIFQLLKIENSKSTEIFNKNQVFEILETHNFFNN